MPDPNFPSDLLVGNDSAATKTFDGIIDEVRVSNIVRSPQWIKTEYKNQNSPSTFYTVYAEETQSPLSVFTFAAAGDHGQNTTTRLSLNALAVSNVNFYLALGDLSYGSVGTESSWCDLVKSQVTETYPFELLSGNHEQDGSADGLMKNFTPCLPNRIDMAGTYGAEYYFDYQNLARIILIAPNLTINGTTYQYTIGSPHYTWLSNVIDDARTQGVPWVIVGMHELCLSIGDDVCQIGPDLMNLLISKQVDLVLQAHDHNYQRSKQLTCATINSFDSSCVVDDGSDNNYIKNVGTVFVITGTFGHSTLNPIHLDDPETGYFAQWSGANINPAYGFMRYTVSADELSAQFVQTNGATFTDNFDIVKLTPTPTPTPTLTPTPTSTTTPTPTGLTP